MTECRAPDGLWCDPIVLPLQALCRKALTPDRTVCLAICSSVRSARAKARRPSAPETSGRESPFAALRNDSISARNGSTFLTSSTFVLTPGQGLVLDGARLLIAA